MSVAAARLRLDDLTRKMEQKRCEEKMLEFIIKVHYKLYEDFPSPHPTPPPGPADSSVNLSSAYQAILVHTVVNYWGIKG